jgi:hypothetical protein
MDMFQIIDIETRLVKWVKIFYQLLDRYFKLKFGQICRSWLLPNDNKEVAEINAVQNIVDELDRAVEYFIPYASWESEHGKKLYWKYSLDYNLTRME